MHCTSRLTWHVIGEVWFVAVTGAAWITDQWWPRAYITKTVRKLHRTRNNKKQQK